MSDEAYDLLIYGIAAAKANSRDEARNYLEWVLRTDADLDQQAQAWYWLSTITDDLAEKRADLENVLAITPNFPEARRDLAILDGRLKPGEMPDPRISVQPVTPATNLAAADVQSFKCPRCGAKMTLDPVAGVLSCGFCGYRPTAAGATSAQNVTQPGSGVREQDWDAAIFAERGHKWELPTTRTYRCESCGASVLVPAGEVSTSCPFCGTPHVVQSEFERELIEPTGLAPFRLSAGEAFAAIVRWLKTEHFIPNDLSSRSSQTTPHPVYFPIWTFDIDGEVRWSGEIIKREMGRPVLVPTRGSVSLLIDDIVVRGSTSVPNEIVSRFHIDTPTFVPYSSDLLANWPAELYSISAAEASIDARDKAIHSPDTTNLIRNSGDFSSSVENITVEATDLSILTYKLLLLPLWVSSYSYEGESYLVVVNGNTGEVAGNVPRNLLQRLLNHWFG